MFERYTESARRVILFARYEASQFGSPSIEVEHLLLGLLRCDSARIKVWLPTLKSKAIRQQIDAHAPRRAPISTSRDLPLSDDSKRVLQYASDEAGIANDKRIGSEHLLLGLLLEGQSFAGQLLRQLHADPAKLRTQIASGPIFFLGPYNTFGLRQRTMGTNKDTVEIHGSRWKVDHVHEVVIRLREHPWHWHKSPWKPRDIVIARIDGTISFDLSLAEDTKNFDLVKEGWQKDHCAICRWELIETSTDAMHTEGYTNGRDWLCTECYEKFWGEPGFFIPPYPEIT